MYSLFNSMEDLYHEIEEDKNWTGAESSLRNRYPIRFVLLRTSEILVTLCKCARIMAYLCKV